MALPVAGEILVVATAPALPRNMHTWLRERATPCPQTGHLLPLSQLSQLRLGTKESRFKFALVMIIAVQTVRVLVRVQKVI
jgi:hypothetical protein